MTLGVRMSLIIYFQPWSESIALAPSIWWISPDTPKPRFLSSSKIGREIFGFGKNNFGNLFLVLRLPLCPSFIQFDGP
jgi:hypothetical protein